MSNDHSPFRRPDPRTVLHGLMAVLHDRDIEAQWHEGTDHQCVMALVGGDGGLEAHAFLGKQRIPKIGRMLMIEAAHPAFLPPEAAQKVAFFCDRSNETLYASKVYLRRTAGEPLQYQVVVERGCVLGQGDLFRLADEFDLLVNEYFMVQEKLEELLAEDEPVSLARQAGLFDGRWRKIAKVNQPGEAEWFHRKQRRTAMRPDARCAVRPPVNSARSWRRTGSADGRRVSTTPGSAGQAR